MIRRKTQVVKPCYFCKENKKPDFLEYEVLGNFISERGKMYSRAKTSLCAKHHRATTREIKRARYLALLPFVVRPE